MKAPARGRAGAFSTGNMTGSIGRRRSPGLLLREHGVAHGVRPELPVFSRLFRRLLHGLEPSLSAAFGWCWYASGFLLGALRREDGEAHRVGPEFPVGPDVLGFLLHGDTSLRVFVARKSAGRFPAGGQDGVRPCSVHPLAQQVDPGVVAGPGCAGFVDSCHHRGCLCFPSLSLLSIVSEKIKSAPV